MLCKAGNIATHGCTTRITFDENGRPVITIVG